MKRKAAIKILFNLLVALLLLGSAAAWAGNADFDAHFEDHTLRMDYLQSGDHAGSFIQFQAWKIEPYWGGRKDYLIFDPPKGEFLIQVLDESGERILYSKGYSSLFIEWQSTSEALTTLRSFYESIVIPLPRHTVMIRLFRRDKKQQFHKIFQTMFDPSSFAGDISETAYPAAKIVDAGDPASHLDLVFLPEGYTEDEMEKFRCDVIKVVSAMFSWAPYDEYKRLINVWIVEAPSRESGTDIPHKGIYKNTLLNSSFDTFGIARYLTTSDYKSVRDVAANAPYDQICILVNSDEYGGAGIYNFYTLFTADNENTEFLFMHEFGHGFVGLADEYYTSEVPYNDFFDLTVEPYQENITTLVDFDKKWKDLLAPDTPVPTPNDPAYSGVIGVFEGAAYSAKGMYRPAYDCTMKSKSIDNFCPVCQRAIRRAIERNMVLSR